MAESIASTCCLEHRLGALGRADGHLLRQSQVDDEGDEVLLGPVVDVALEAAPLGIEGVDQASARQLELVGPRGQLHGASGQLGAKADTAQHQPGLRCEAGEQAFLDRRQRLVVVLLEPQHAEMFTGEYDVQRAKAWVGSTRPSARPAPCPGPARGELGHVVDHQPHLCPASAGALREQLRHPQRQVGSVVPFALTDDGVREPAQRVVRRSASLADPARGLGLEPRPHRLEADSDDRGRQHRQTQLRGVGVADQQAAAHHDHDIDGGDPGDRPDDDAGSHAPVAQRTRDGRHLSGWRRRR